MKIAFKGFRGFGEDTVPFEITPITILTGKNGSGKSTLIKLVEMISNSFKDIKSIQNLFDLSIDIGNDIYGGKAVTFCFFACTYSLGIQRSKKYPKTLVQKKAIALHRSLSCQNAYSIAFKYWFIKMKYSA